MKNDNPPGKANWTEFDLENLKYYVSADFIDQLDSFLELKQINQKAFAKLLKVTEGRVSQVMNDPGNLTLDTMLKWSRAAGAKAGIVIYNDNDPENIQGPISGSMFVKCWQRIGSPKNATSFDIECAFSGHYDRPQTFQQPHQTDCNLQSVSLKILSCKNLGYSPKQTHGSTLELLPS